MNPLEKTLRIMAFGGALATLTIPPLMMGLQIKGGMGLILFATTAVAIVGFVGLITIKRRGR